MDGVEAAEIPHAGCSQHQWARQGLAQRQALEAVEAARVPVLATGGTSVQEQSWLEKEPKGTSAGVRTWSCVVGHIEAQALGLGG